MEEKDLEIIDKQIIMLRKIAINSSYFSEIFHKMRELPFDKMVLFSEYQDPANGFIYHLYNLNLYRYLLVNNRIMSFYCEKIYQESYRKGYDFFIETWSDANAKTFKTWNTLLALFTNKKSIELLDLRKDYTENEILSCSFNNGFLKAYLEYEQDNDLLLISYLSLQNSSIAHFSKFKVPIANYYQYNMPAQTDSPIKVDHKVEFIILKEIGHINELLSQNSNAEVARIVSNEINQKYKDFEVSNSCTANNIKNILTADYGIPDYTNPKSAYKKSNIRKALFQLNKMGVSLYDCKYLKELEMINPDLFD